MDALDELLTRPHDNRPPVLEVLRDELEVENIALLRRKDELLSKLPLMPETVDDDEMAGRFSDMTKAVAACLKNADAARVAKKEVFLEGGRAVDGFFKKKVIDPLDGAKRSIEARLGVYLKAKAAREKAIRDQAERAAREAAQRAAAEAAKAAAAMQDEKDLTAALAAQERAQEAAIASVAASKAAAAKPAEMSRTRGDVGSLGTLRQVWTFADLDRAAIDLEALRPYLSEDDIGKALRLAIKAGMHSIRGARIFEDQVATVR